MSIERGNDVAQWIDRALPDNVKVFVDKEGKRGLKTLEDIDRGAKIFIEKPFLWFTIKEDSLGLGMQWGLTRHIAVNLPKAIPVLETKLKLRASFQPPLQSSDKKKLARISKESRLTQAKVRKVYNFVCTYHLRTSLRLITGEGCVFGENAFMSIGLIFTNHSCDPNCRRIPITSIAAFRSGLAGLEAIREIRAGEEMTWNYLGQELPEAVRDRQRLLRREYGFYCTCARCRQEKQETIDAKMRC